MGFTTAGYDGTLDEVQLAKLLPRYSVVGPEDFKATTQAGDRIVAISDGIALGPGTVDVATAIPNIQFAAAATGTTRWDLVALRRDWQPPGGSSSIVIIQGGSAKGFPAVGTATTAWNRRPGIVDDQPLYLQQVNGTLLGERVDLRVWNGGGGLFAKDDMVRQYMNQVGTDINIRGVNRKLQLGDNDAEQWTTPNFDGIPADARQIVKTGNIQVGTTPNGDAYYYFSSPFPNAMVSCVASDSTDPAHWPALILKYAAVYSDRTRFCFRVYDHAGNILTNKTGLWLSYIAVGY